MKKRIHIDSVMIEITRKCNMDCDHCMRGKAQNCDIDNKYIEGLFLKVESIYLLSITGGEPSLAPEKIRAIIELAEKHNVIIDHFYIATNGQKVTNEFIKVLLDLYLFCDTKEDCQLHYSNDRYHEYCIDDEREYKRNIDMLKAFSFTGTKHDMEGNNQVYDYREENIIRQGNGYLNFGDNVNDTHNIYSVEIEDNSIRDIEFYLNALGNVVLCCDLSYDTQDEDFFNIGNILDIDIIEAVKAFNERLEEIGENNISTILMELEDADVV